MPESAMLTGENFQGLLAFMLPVNYVMTVWIPFDKGICTDHQGDIWVQHFWVAVSMVFFMAATMFTLLKLSGIFFCFHFGLELERQKLCRCF
jgi:hypothetical protein